MLHWSIKSLVDIESLGYSITDNPQKQLHRDELHTTRQNLSDEHSVLDIPPAQTCTDGLHTTTPTATSSTMHIYRSQMDPPSQACTIQQRSIEYHYEFNISMKLLCQMNHSNDDITQLLISDR